VLGLGHPRDRRGLLTGHLPDGIRGGHARQMRQRPPGPDHPRGLGGRQVPVPAQPRGHRLQPVDLRGPGHLALPHRAGHFGGEPVLRHQQRAQPVEKSRAEHGGQVVAGERLQGSQQLVHDTSHRFDHVFEV
jgi:hypothetical protein